MKENMLKSKEGLVVEIYMPNPKRIPSLDYCYHAADWALCYPLRSNARAILNAAQGLAWTAMPMDDWNGGKCRNYFRFEFKDSENLRIFWEMIKEYL